METASKRTSLWDGTQKQGGVRGGSLHHGRHVGMSTVDGDKLEEREELVVSVREEAWAGRGK